MRDLYNKASASAASLATELRESTSLAERLQRQLTEGLQARDAFAARQREKYESEHARLRAQLALLREQAVRTDDMVRQKAAEWDAMEAREAEREREREKRRKAREEEQRRLMAAQEMEEEEADADYIESGFIPALRAAGMVPDAPPSGDVPPPAPAPTGQSSALIREGTIVSGEQSGAIAPSSAALAEAEAAMRAAKASELEAARAEVVHELEAFERAASAGQGEDQDQEEEDMQMQLRMQMQMEMQLQLQQMQNSDLETGTEPTVQAWVSAEPGLQESSSSFEPLTQAQ